MAEFVLLTTAAATQSLLFFRMPTRQLAPNMRHNMQAPHVLVLLPSVIPGTRYPWAQPTCTRELRRDRSFAELIKRCYFELPVCFCTAATRVQYTVFPVFFVRCDVRR